MAAKKTTSKPIQAFTFVNECEAFGPFDTEKELAEHITELLENGDDPSYIKVIRGTLHDITVTQKIEVQA